MSDGGVRYDRDGAVARLTFDRPEARNALTSKMYGEFEAACRDLAQPGEVRVVVLRGAGGQAFVAGTDIGDLEGHIGADAGLAYERRMEEILDTLIAIPVPTIAAVEGLAVGGGLNIAGNCDLRIATQGARFGTPIARTLGNCLSMRNYARLIDALGEARAKRMLMLSELLTPDDLDGSGFITRVAAPADFETELGKMVDQILAAAPISLAISKQAIARLKRDPVPDGDDLIRRCYGSDDIAEGVAAFRAKRRPIWQGT